MLIKSPAGEFPITIERFEVEGSELVIVGKMGVWDARTHVGPRDFLIPVELPRPRDMSVFSTRRYVELKSHVLGILYQEALQSFAAGSRAAADFVQAFEMRHKAGAG